MLGSLLRQVIKERGFTLEEVGRSLSPPRDHSWVSRVLYGTRKIALPKIEELLDVVGEPRVRFWRRHLEAIGGLASPQFADIEPAALFRSIVDRDKVALPDSLKVILDDRLSTLHYDPLPRLPRRLRELDQVRRQHPELGYIRALEWVEDCYAHVRAHRKSRIAYAELVAALGVLASAARRAGNSRAAAYIFMHAFDRIVGAPSGVLAADLLSRSGGVLVDAGFPTLAVTFLERAIGLFWVADQGLDEVRTGLSLGVQYLHIGRYRTARSAFERCLRHDAATDDDKIAALGNLAWLSERTNEPEEALAILDSVEESGMTPSGRVATSLRWIRARALAQSGDLEAAASHFSGLEPDIVQYCEPADPFLLFCDYAAVLIRCSDAATLHSAAKNAARHLEALQDKPALGALAKEALKQAVSAAADVTSIRSVRRRIADAAGA